jgi:hypothetical protein
MQRKPSIDEGKVFSKLALNVLGSLRPVFHEVLQLNLQLQAA